MIRRTHDPDDLEDPMTTPGSHGPGEQPPSGGSGWGPPAGAPQQAAVPPPPPGQFPHGQYPPQGQPAPGQFPQGQYPPPQGQPAPGQFGGQAWTPQPQAQPSSKVGKWVGIAAGVVAVLIIGILALAFLGGDPEVGDCLREDGEELAVVDCDDSDAAWRLVGIQDGEQSYDEYLNDPETCADFLPEAIQSFWVGENGDETGQGAVYCVAAA
jgi:hypothetical protein